MRTIKFRGKRIDTGEWCEGYYATKGVDEETLKHFICVPQFSAQGSLYEQMFYLMDYEVDLASVGQFTGLYDKNNKEIYENDIIELTEKMIDGNGKTKYVGKVLYEKGCFHFRMDKINLIILGYVDKKQIKIIGNIHDNPELLK